MQVILLLLLIAPTAPLREGVGRRVEVFFDGKWGGVCSDGWSDANSQVVCRQLDMIAVSQSPIPDDPIVWLSGVRCSGSEMALSQCSHRGWGTNSDCTGPVIANCTSGN